MGRLTRAKRTRKPATILRALTEVRIQTYDESARIQLRFLISELRRSLKPLTRETLDEMARRPLSKPTQRTP